MLLDAGLPPAAHAAPTRPGLVPVPLMPPTVPVAPADVQPVPANPAPPPPPAAPPPTSPLPTQGSYQITGNDAALSVFAVSADAQELFTALAEKAGLRLVVDDTVSRRLTVNILHKPARQILDDIISAYGLSSAEVEGVTMICEGIPRSPSSYLLPVFLQDYVKV